jgi:hypothetical protein
VPCFTEYKQSDGTCQYLYRAHPCYRAKETTPQDVWYDWAWFEIEDGICLPCQVMCFMDLSTMPELPDGMDEIPSYRGYLIDQPTQYAVVRKFRAESIEVEYSMLVEWGDLDEGFYILPLFAIRGPVCVVPNIPMISWEESRGGKKKRDRKEERRERAVAAPLGGYFVVRGQQEWEEVFTDEVVLNNEVELNAGVGT